MRQNLLVFLLQKKSPFLSLDEQSLKFLHSMLVDQNCLFYFAFIIAGILQFTIFYDIYTMFQVKEKTKLFSNLRSIELLLESAPEALLQMFIVLKDNSLNNISSLSKYYLSIGSSVLNLISGIVSYEIFLHNYYVFCNVVREYDHEGNIIEEAKESPEETPPLSEVKHTIVLSTTPAF